ncbi:MAG TPA: hypothetical protein VGI39_41120 [Polyangiaceae bacterium]
MKSTDQTGVAPAMGALPLVEMALVREATISVSLLAEFAEQATAKAPLEPSSVAASRG